MWLAEELVCIRDRNGEIKPLFANRAQWEFEQKRARQNIVLKARQLGMTTWIAARFFLKTVIVPGTMTVQVAHTQQAAEAIFRMVHRMLEWMPDGFGGGVLEGARSSAGSCPAMASATSRPLAQASVKPSDPCPVFSHKFE